MNNTAKANTQDSDIFNNLNSESGTSLLEKIRNTHTEELVIGLCGFIGTNIDIISKTISKVLSEQFKYEVIEIKLSDLIKQFGNVSSPITWPVKIGS